MRRHCACGMARFGSRRSRISYSVDAGGPAALTAWLGPAISQPAYEVGPAVKDAFQHVPGDSSQACFGYPSTEQEGHWMADIYALARLHLTRAGVSEIQGVSAVRMVRRINSSPIAVMVIPPGAWRR